VRYSANIENQIYVGTLALYITELIFEKIVLMLVATPGMIAPAETATKPAIKAYSMRSCAFLSLSDSRIFQRRVVAKVMAKYYGDFRSPQIGRNPTPEWQRSIRVF
jgi:hypothetical protein